MVGGSKEFHRGLHFLSFLIYPEKVVAAWSPFWCTRFDFDLEAEIGSILESSIESPGDSRGLYERESTNAKSVQISWTLQRCIQNHS